MGSRRKPREGFDSGAIERETARLDGTDHNGPRLAEGLPTRIDDALAQHYASVGIDEVQTKVVRALRTAEL